MCDYWISINVGANDLFIYLLLLLLNPPKKRKITLKFINEKFSTSVIMWFSWIISHMRGYASEVKNTAKKKIQNQVVLF